MCWVTENGKYRLVVMRFTQAVVRARPISPVGAEQVRRLFSSHARTL